MVRKAGSRQEYYIFEAPLLPGQKKPRHARLAFIEVKPRSGQDRRVYLPIVGRRMALEALHDNADIFSYSYKPYVNSEWLIGYLIGQKDQDAVDDIANLVTRFLIQAENEDLNEI